MKSGVIITCGLLLLSGCAQGNLRQSVARSFCDTVPATSRERADIAESLLDKDLPPVRSAEITRSSVPLLRAQNADNPGVALSSSSATKTTSITHDAATLALIDKETRDFSPEDRERAIATLKAIPSDSVAAVLQLWKAGLISPFPQPKSPVILAPASAADLPPRTDLISGQSPAPDAGLGQRSPWSSDTGHRSNYTPPDWNPQAGGPGSSGRSQEIARVNTLPTGYSPPFADDEQRLGLIEAGEKFDKMDYGPSDSTGVNAGQYSSYNSTSTYAQDNSRPTPPDWSSAPQNAPQVANQIANSAGSFAPDSGRRLVVPAPWQSTTNSRLSRPAAQLDHSYAVSVPRSVPLAAPPIDRAPAIATSKPPALAMDTASRTSFEQIRSRLPFRRPPAAIAAAAPAPIEKPQEPLIRPQTRDSRAQAAAQSPIQRLGFSRPEDSDLDAEIPLTPGQTLPGFEENSPAIQQPLYEREVPLARPPVVARRPEAVRPIDSQIVPGEFISDRDAPAWNTASRAQPLPTPNDALKLLIRATEHEVAGLRPGTSATELQYYIERQVYLRLLYQIAGQSELALRPIPNIPAADQEFWTQVIWGVQNYFDLPRIPDHAERASQTIAQFNTAMLRLKERAPLELKNVTFCHKIDGYGEFDNYAKDEFSPGERVLVYAEIANFHSELSAEGIYRTRLKSTLQISSAEAPQDPIDVKVYPVTEDYCRNHRRDYFHSYVVEIPARCVRGAHLLKLVVEDEQSGKVTTGPIPFTVR